MRIGEHELDTEGPTDVVQEQIKIFKEMVAQASTIAPTPATLSGTGLVTQPSPLLTSAAPVGISEEVLNRVFRRDNDGVSLLGLPRSDDADADALVALLYGYNRLQNRPNVTGVALMQAARQSGVSLLRADKALHRKADLIMAAGSRRGRRYSLNNRGTIYAEDLVRRMVE
jgi:hypothetical protein